MRKTILVALIGMLAAACGSAPRTGPAAGDDLLFVVTGSTVASVDTRTHTVLGDLPLGVPAPDWTHYYLVSGSVLEDYDPMTGRVIRSLPLPGRYALPVVTASGAPGGLSQNGQYLVLQAPNDGTSHLLVVDTSFTRAPVRVDNLHGDFQFDAISNDGVRVYLIQHTGDGHYFVRDYVLGTGLDPTIIFDKSDGAAAMSGLRLMGVASPTGEILYSVYARKDQSAFIHQLSLDGPVAFCIDLSGPGYGGDSRAMRWSLAMTRDGARLFAANSLLGVVSELWLTSNDKRTVPFDRAAMHASAGALITPDGRSLVIAGTGVRWLDPTTLHTTAIALDSWTVAGIAFAPDGGSLYVVSDTGQIAQLDGSGHTIASFDSGLRTAGTLIHVGRFS
jgi:hypothetical protein